MLNLWTCVSVSYVKILYRLLRSDRRSKYEKRGSSICLRFPFPLFVWLINYPSKFSRHGDRRQFESPGRRVTTRMTATYSHACWYADRRRGGRSKSFAWIMFSATWSELLGRDGLNGGRSRIRSSLSLSFPSGRHPLVETTKKTTEARSKPE